MALISRIYTGKHSLSGLFNRLCKVSKYNNVQVAHISGRLNRTGPPLPPPFPYHEKVFGIIDNFLDYTIERFDENSRIVVVEGPVAAGKDKFARELAKELEMGYMPAPTFDRLCVDNYGNDIRSVQDAYPENIQICDIPKFLSNPRHANAQAFQLTQCLLRFDDYIESLLHVLSTGEGVVINRSFYSNFVFMKAMYNAGYMNQRCRRFYEKVVSQIRPYSMRPHLVIYLDVPVNIVQERIKKRAIPYEVNSEVLTTKFLTDIETIYKQEYLPKIENHTYLLMYDWSYGGDISDVVEDIERLPIEYDYKDQKKLEDWVFPHLTELKTRRKLYSHESRLFLMMKSAVTDFEVEEMYIFGDDVKVQSEMIEKHHAKYDTGYNPDKGDSVLWKDKSERSSANSRVIPYKDL